MKQCIGAAFGLGLAAAAIGGIAAWQATPQGVSRAGGVASHVATDSLPSRMATPAGLAAAQELHSFVFYLVGSQGQAGVVRSQMQAAEENVGGPLAERYAVVVINSADDEALLYQAAGEASLWAAMNGSSEVYRVVDLRPRPDSSSFEPLQAVAGATSGQ